MRDAPRALAAGAVRSQVAGSATQGVNEMQLAEEVARLADAVEQVVDDKRRHARADRAQQLAEHWGEPVPPVTLGTFLRSVPGLAAKFDKTVPDEFVAQVGDGVVTIACPCGEEPAVRLHRLASCECGRWFLHDGRTVHVALSPTSASPDPVRSGEAENAPATDAG